MPAPVLVMPNEPPDSLMAPACVALPLAWFSVTLLNNLIGLVTFTPKVEACVPSLHAAILTQDYQRLASLDLSDFLSADPIKVGERASLGFRIESLPLLPGNYQLKIHLKDLVHTTTELIPDPIPFEIVETPVYGGRKLNQWFGFIGLQVQPIAEFFD